MNIFFSITIILFIIVGKANYPLLIVCNPQNYRAISL